METRPGIPEDRGGDHGTCSPRVHRLELRERWLVRILALAGTFLWLPRAADAEEPHFLWQIGVADNDTGELALARDGYARYADDPLFVVGTSEPQRDWPYVQPGPNDAWAGSRPHESAIVFTLGRKPSTGQCRLLVDLVDTQKSVPPRLAVLLNQRELLTIQMPAGNGDASVYGNPAQGREHRFEVDVPLDGLVEGLNEITLRSVAGSWILYDWIGLAGPDDLELLPTRAGTLLHSVAAEPLLVEQSGRLMQAVQLTIRHFDQPVAATLQIGDAAPLNLELRTGLNRLDALQPAVERATPVAVQVAVGDTLIARRELVLEPVRRWTIYVLPHSHVDIGYTELQTKVERDQWRFLEEAIDASRRTADYPPGSQFKWNVEVLWAVESYLKQAPPEKQAQFIAAVKQGWIGLDALYGNELTALCRPEELLRLMDYAAILSQRCGVTIDSAMISDVPGYTWGLTTALAEAGVKYFSIGPNGGHRIGYTLEAWGDKPFYWITPSGEDRILCWIPRTGYYRAFNSETQILDLVRRSAESGYPYDLIQVRYCLGDNAGPGVELSDLVRDWNAKYAYPRLVIATNSEMMREFERRYGATLPAVRGDFTPYWEDGAGSSAYETGLNRRAAERLYQAEAIWSLLRPQEYPSDAFWTAWRNVILYDEHTWGAHNSISEPDSEFARSQWAIKQTFAVDADDQSRRLLTDGLAPLASASSPVAALLVFNTSSWPRTDLVVVPPSVKLAGDRVVDPEGKPVPSQRLASGEFAFLAETVPPLGAKRFDLLAGEPSAGETARAAGTSLANGSLEVRVDETSGSISSVRKQGIAEDLVDETPGLGWNAYRYVAGRDPAQPQANEHPTVRVKDAGPLVASLSVESAAPGCRKLVREVRLVAGLDHVELWNLIDKEKVRTPEAVHFGFALRVPDGVMHIESPLAVVRPEEDQLAGACKNYFTVGRWIDVSNPRYGVTWSSLDAPLVEVGRIRCDPTVVGWVRSLEPSATFFSYAMNNYWETNYKADQEGPTPVRYAVRPHAGPYDPVQAARFGAERSQPLVAVPVAAGVPAIAPPRLQVEPGDVMVTALRPSHDGQAMIVRLFNPSQNPVATRIAWSEPRPVAIWRSNLSEQRESPITGAIELPALGLVTLRAEMNPR